MLAARRSASSATCNASRRRSPPTFRNNRAQLLALLFDVLLCADVAIQIDAFPGDVRERLGIDVGNSRSRRNISQVVVDLLLKIAVVFPCGAAFSQHVEQYLRELHTDQPSNAQANGARRSSSSRSVSDVEAAFP